ncbi:hypothetical protein Bca52824_038071 [Brassica carinata]|uniref:Uncharacterized protein n=1 Tax=Brassica carinata TaxID=52824 RepID=A0A8X7RNU5_BRACI|nr:hypothetical protein Bca52824_038071 [Brassica carinata]
MYSVSSSSFISTFSPKPSLHLRHSSSSRLLPRINSTVFEERSPISNPSENNVPPPSKYKKLYTRTNRNAVASPAKLRPETTLVTALFTTVEDVFNTFIDPPSRPSVDPKDVLSGNFAPVLDELPPTECEIIHGSLPPSLDGAYIRNGPSPQFLPRGPYHLFDGDGMLHAIRISNGAQVIPNVFSGFNGVTASVARGALTAFRVLAGQYNPVNGIGLANTSLAFFCNRLFALGESDLPYAVRLTNTGDIETIGRFDFDGKFLEMSMTAHPKTDPQTGDTFAFRYSPRRSGLLLDVSIVRSRLRDHEEARNIRGDSDRDEDEYNGSGARGGSPVGADNRKTPRVGVIPRYAGDDSEMKWFEVPGFNIIHAINAWDENDGNTVIPNVFSGFNGVTASVARGALTAFRVLAGQYNPVNGIGLANTSLAFFCNRLFALGESDLPYAVRLTNTGDIETIGRFDFDGKFLEMSMTAHPKTDPQTGDTFAFRYSPRRSGLLLDVSIVRSRLRDHEEARNIRGDSDRDEDEYNGSGARGGSPVGADNRKTPRVGVIPRYAGDDSEMKWFEVPGFNIIHAINAWDENDGNTVVLIAPNVMSIEHTLERMDLFHALVEKVKIDLVTGIVTRHPISARNLDFAVINPAFLGRRSRYVYAAIGDPIPKISGVEAEEDDGYVVTYVHDEVAGESKFLVMDAKSPELEIVAAVRLPRRVPYGFHGLFVKESDINKALTKTKD